MGIEPDRRRWRMKEGRNGAAVKVLVPLQGAKKFWEPQGGGEAEDAAGSLSAAASVGASVLCTEVSTGHPHPVASTKKYTTVDVIASMVVLLFYNVCVFVI